MSEEQAVYCTWQAMELESLPPMPGETPEEFRAIFMDFIQMERDRAIAKVRQCDNILYGRRDHTIPTRQR